MRVINADETGRLDLGMVGEDRVTAVEFHYGDLEAEFHGEGTLNLIVKYPGIEGAVDRPLEIDHVEKTATWLVTEQDMTKAGAGEAQLIYTFPNGRKKRKIWFTLIDNAIADSIVPPPDWQGFVDKMVETGAKVESAVQHYPKIGENDDWFVWDVEAGAFVDTGIKARGRAPYCSLERIRSYLFKITFDSIPEYDESVDVFLPGGCSSLVTGGKLYRNFDWMFDEAPTFHMVCKGFSGIAVDNRITDGFGMSDTILGQLPYHVVDGINDHGIMMSTHVLFNDWQWTGSGERIVPLTLVPYLILTRVKSMATIHEDLSGIIENLRVVDKMGEYLAQYLITDGTITFALMPPTSADESYVLTDITDCPKLTNFRWVDRETVERNADYMQDRPTGVERWNEMTTDLEALRFTKAYEQADRLSEFIGIAGTTKLSSDEELEAIYSTAREKYIVRERDGELWQTMHSVIYSAHGMESLCVQENWSNIIQS